MIELRTTTCRTHQHPEFRIAVEPRLVPLESDARWLIAWLEESVARGERFSDGQTCQIGWSITQIRQASDERLALWEPDMRQFPISWIDSVSHTLSQLRQQKDVCESVVSAGDSSFPSMLQSAIVCTRLGQTAGIVMERTASSDMDSGWFCGCSDENHDHNSVDELRRVSLYEAAVCYTFEVVPYLALPEGVLLQADERGPAIFMNGERVDLKSGSYLAHRFAVK
jgi:hypothetical protein